MGLYGKNLQMAPVFHKAKQGRLTNAQRSNRTGRSDGVKRENLVIIPIEHNKVLSSGQQGNIANTHIKVEWLSM